MSEYASIPKKLEIDEEGGYVGLVVGISNTVAQDRFQIVSTSCYEYRMLHMICSAYYAPYEMISCRVKDYSLVKLITEQLSVASKTLYDAAEGRVFLKKGKVQK